MKVPLGSIPQSISCCLGHNRFWNFLQVQYLISISWFLGEIPSIENKHILKVPLGSIQNFNFMFFDWYWSHIQDFQDFIQRIVGMFRRPSVRKLTKFGISKIVRFIKMTRLTNVPGICRDLFLVSWCLQR